MTVRVAKEDRIRFWNDHLRTFHRGGKVLLTRGIASLDAATQTKIVRAVSEFSQFTPDNDPHKEHDCAIPSVEGHRKLRKWISVLSESP